MKTSYQLKTPKVAVSAKVSEFDLGNHHLTITGY